MTLLFHLNLIATTDKFYDLNKNYIFNGIELQKERGAQMALLYENLAVQMKPKILVSVMN